MPNTTKEEPTESSADEWRPNPAIMNKSWVELAEEDEEDFYKDLPDTEQPSKPQSAVKTELKAIPEETATSPNQPSISVKLEATEEKKCPYKRIDFGVSSPLKACGSRDEVMESPMKVEPESPLKDMESPLKLDDESPMKTETPVKSENTTPRKHENGSPGVCVADVTKRLWASPSRRYRDHALNLAPRVSPRRPMIPPLLPDELLSPPRESLKRKRPHDIFKSCSSPASSVGSPGSDRSSVFSPRPKRRPVELETDPEILRRRQKQIDYGKNTESYRCYLEAVPKHKRTHRHPQTPPREVKHSRRAWDGMIRAWRQHLHNWDPPGLDGNFENIDCLDMTDSMSELSEMGSGCLSDNISEISYPGSGSKLKPAQRPASTLSLEDFPPLS